MSSIFTSFADWAIKIMGLSLDTQLGSSVHFFIEDTFKIFVLIYVMIFVVSLFRYQLSPEKIRYYLHGKSKWWGYVLAVILGVVTPFCTCSSIPLFIGFVAAGIPFGVTMAFLISSPLISEIAAIMLFGMQGAGPMVAGIYIFVGAVISILGGWLCDAFHLERFVISLNSENNHDNCSCHNHSTVKEKWLATVLYADKYATDTVKEIGWYVLAGLALGAFMHGYIPQELFIKYLGAENIWSVPMAAVAGIPIYANHNSVIPIIQVLLLKGVPLGTSLVMLMSITAISLPEMIMLHKVLTWKMLSLFTLFLFVSFIIVGYLLNYIM